MKVYCVFEGGGPEGEFLHDIFLTQNKAEALRDEMNAKRARNHWLYGHFFVQEWEIQE